MIKNIILIFIIGLLVQCRTSQSLPIKKKLFIEADSLTNINNIIYEVGTKMLFSTYFVVNNDTLYCSVIDTIPSIHSDFNLVEKANLGKNDIYELKAEILKKVSFGNQTTLELKYLNISKEEIFTTFPGIIENKHNHWWHPPRMYYFYVTEFSPFPMIKYPLTKGLNWKQKIFLYPIEENDKWIPKFDTKQLVIESTYEIKGEQKIETKFGKLTCYVTEAEAVNIYGKGYLTSYFNEKYGFVKLDYRNIDGSRLIIELIEFQKPD